MPRKSAKIDEIRGMLRGVKAEEIAGIKPESLKALAKQYETVPDVRFKPFIEHKLSDIVLITMLAVMTEADEWIEIGIFARKKEGWLRKFLELPNGIPSHDTIQRVMSQINGQYLYSLTINFLIVRIEKLYAVAWELKIAEGEGKADWKAEPVIVAFDGKASKGSKRNKTDKEAEPGMQTVSAYSTEYGLCLTEGVIAEKTNEIPTVQAMLDMTAVKGCIVTWDALNTQKGTVAAVIRNHGDYVGALKDNHPTFHREVKEYFSEARLLTIKQDKSSRKSYKMTEEKEQSGVAKREYYLSGDIECLSERKEWAGLKAIGCVKRTLVKKDGKTIADTRYFISSVVKIDEFSKAVRQHWGIENKIHWQLDYTFGDDHNTTMEKNGAQNLQTMKRVTLAILGLAKTFFGGISIKNIRYNLALDFEKNIEDIFKLLNADELRRLLLPKST
jgi:predicted transposase YbfD/YdcC